MTNDLQIRSFLKRLRIPVVAQNFTRLAEEAAANNQTFQCPAPKKDTTL